MSNFRVGQNLLFVAAQKLALVILGKQVVKVPHLQVHFPVEVLPRRTLQAEFTGSAGEAGPV